MVKEKLRGLAFNGPNFVKINLISNVSGYSITEVSNLFMHLLQKVQAGPPSKPHDNCINLS